MNFIEPVYHYETLTFEFEVIKVDKMKDVVTISVEAINTEDHRIFRCCGHGPAAKSSSSK